MINMLPLEPSRIASLDAPFPVERTVSRWFCDDVDELRGSILGIMERQGYLITSLVLLGSVVPCPCGSVHVEEGVLRFACRVIFGNESELFSDFIQEVVSGTPVPTDDQTASIAVLDGCSIKEVRSFISLVNDDQMFLAFHDNIVSQDTNPNLKDACVVVFDYDNDTSIVRLYFGWSGGRSMSNLASDLASWVSGIVDLHQTSLPVPFIPNSP